MAHRKVINARIVIETNAESPERTLGYVVSALKAACRNTRDGSVLITIYDDEDHMLGADLSGTPSEELQSDLEDLLDKFEDQIAHPPIMVRPSPPPVRPHPSPSS